MSNSKPSIKVNLIYQIAYQCLVVVLPFITSPYIARVLGAEKLGIYSYSYSVVVYFGLFASLGINQYGNRSIAKARDNQERLSQTFSSIFYLHIILTLLALFVYLLYLVIVVDANKEIAWIQTLYLIYILLDINWFYYGIEKFNITVTRNAIIKLLTLLSIFIFVKQDTDLWKYTLIMSSGLVLGQIPLWASLKKYTVLCRPTWREMVSHVKPMLVLFVAAVAISIYIHIGKIMLGNIINMEAVGFYENANKMIDFPVGFVTALGTVMLPRMSNLVEAGDMTMVKKYIKNSMHFAVSASIAIAFGVSAISMTFSVVFWGENFAPSGEIMSVLAFNTIIISWNNVIRTQYLIPMKKDRVYVSAVCSGAVVNILTNLVMIPAFGGVGAAIGTLSAYLTVCLVQTLSVRKELPILQYVKEGLPYLLIGGSMLFVVQYAIGCIDHLVTALIVGVIAGVFYFCIISVVYIWLFNDIFWKNIITGFLANIKRGYKHETK